MGKNQTGDGETYAQQQHKRQHGADGFPLRCFVAGALILGQHHLTAHAQAHTRRGKQAGNLAADGNAGQSRRAHKLPHNNHIHHGIDGLEHIRRQKRHGKGQQPPWDAAGEKILVLE